MTNPLMQCIEREREAVEALHVSNPGCLSPTCRCAPRTKLNAARAATDEAVRAVEVEVERLRAVNADLLSKWQASESRHVQTVGTHIQAIADLKRINEKLAVLSRRLIEDPSGGEAHE